MGKALVINGLSVSDPICEVTFMTADSVLRNYLLANSTINDTEKDALKAFVQGLIDADLWSKFKYFYPMLGSTVSDMVIDTVNPATEDIFSADTIEQHNGFVVSNRVLRAGTDETSDITTKREYAAKPFANERGLDATKIGFIHAGEVLHSSPYDTYPNTWWNLPFYFSNLNTTYSRVGIEGGTGTPKMAVDASGVTTTLNGTNDYTTTERVLFANYNGGKASLYRNAVRQAQENFVSATVINRLFYVYQGKGAIWFNAIVEGMTENEWQTTVYPLLSTFLSAVGKRTV